MKRPIAKQRSPRTVAPEIAYLDDMRRHRQKPGSFDELSDMAIQMYEAEADLYVAHDTHPDIMDEYDEHDKGEDKLCLEAIALAGVLLEHRRPEAQLTFEDFVVPEPDDAVVRVQESSIGKALLAGPDTQFAIKSDGSHYPVLDIRRKNLTLNGISVRAWGVGLPTVGDNQWTR